MNLANNIEDISQKIEWSDVFIETLQLGYNELNNEMTKRLDIETLVNKKYEGYKIEEEEIKPIILKKEIYGECEISSSPCEELVEIGWTREDILEYNPRVLDEFARNYTNRYELDRHPADVPTGIIVQIMPLTMMRVMRGYGRTYPREMERYAGGIYRVINCGNFYRLDDGNYYSFDRSSFRVLSEQEVRDRGL